MASRKVDKELDEDDLEVLQNLKFYETKGERGM